MKNWIPIAIILISGCGMLKLNVNGKSLSDQTAEPEARKVDPSEATMPTTPASIDPSQRLEIFKTSAFELKTNTRSKGFEKSCGFGFTSEQPAAKINLVSTPEDLSTRTNVDGVLLKDGRIYCIKKGRFAMKWEPGTYEYYPMMESARSGAWRAQFEFVSTNVLEKIAAEALAKNSINLAVDANPSQLRTDVGSLRVRPADLSMGCTGQYQYLQPLGQLTLDRAAKLNIDLENGSAYVRTADGKCIKPKGQLTAGTHQLWGAFKELRTQPVSLAILDEQQPMKFVAAQTVNAGRSPTSKATVLNFSVSEKGLRHKNLCGEGATEPSFFVKVKSKYGSEIFVTSGPRKLKTTIVGPLESASPKIDCGRNSQIPGVPGTFAVFVNHDSKTAIPATAVVGNRSSINPMTQTRKPAKNLEFADRELTHYYGNYPTTSTPAEAIFNSAPTLLFVYSKSASGGIPEDTALLLHRYGKEKSDVLKPDGSIVTVPTSELVGDKPANVNTLTTSAPERPTTIRAAHKVGGPNQDVLFHKYAKKEAKFDQCVTVFMRKNDPTWNKNYDLVNLRTGKTIKDKTYQRAFGKCGLKRLNSAADQLINAVYKSRLKDQSRYKTIKKRF